MDPQKAPLTKGRILSAALRIADGGGIDALSMRRLAGELRVQAMSLYNHMANKDEIIDGLVELVIGEIEVPDVNEPWKDAMRDRASSAHRMLLRHPWAIVALMTRANAGPTMLRYVNATLACLREAGFSTVIADRAWNAMDNHIYGYTLQEVNFPFEEPEYAGRARAFLERIPPQQYPYFTELASLIKDGKYTGVRDFSFGLDLILDGLDRYRGAA